MARKPPARKPVEQQNLLAPKTAVGIGALRHVTESYSLPVPPALTDAQKDIEFPDDISAVHGDDLAAMMSRYTALQNYAVYQATLLATDISFLGSRIDGMVEEQLHRMTGATITEKKARARMHPAVKEAREKLELQQGVYDLIKALSGNYERCYHTISREVTRRQSIVEV